MRRSITLFLALALTITLVIGCSSGGGGQLTLPQVSKPAAVDHIGTHLWGTYQVIIDKTTSNVDIVKLRGAEQIINVLGFLEPPALKNLLIDFVTLNIDPANNYIGVDVILKHPIPDPVFMGFDVRGVVFGPDIMNADGVTPVMNPADFSGEAFGYINGLLGSPDSYAHYNGLWGYKYFCDGLLLNGDLATFFSNETNLAGRGVFRNNSTNARHYDLSWVGKTTPIDFLIFNYAVYANYDWPVGSAPIDIDDFSPTANCSEVFCFKPTEVANSLWYNEGLGSGGGNISLDVEVWDWQGLGSTGVTLDGVAPTSTDPGTTSKSGIYHFVDYAPTLSSAGSINLLIKATDNTTFGEAWFMGLLSNSNPLYGEKLWSGYIYSASVSECPAPVVTAIDPDSADSGDAIDDATVTGSGFITGPLLGVKLQMTGQTDIIATDVKFIDGNTITCDLDLTGAWGGKWDVTVVNGCGTPGAGSKLFTVVGGFMLITSGNLPAPLPYTNAKEFCVVGDNTNNRAGVYYFDSNYTVRFYSLDYATSSVYLALTGTAATPDITKVLGQQVDPRSIEVDATGGLLITTSGTNLYFGTYLANQCTTWWAANNPQCQNGLVLNALYGTVRSRDASTEFDGYGIIWSSYAVEADFNYSGNNVEIVHNGVGYPYSVGSYATGWNINWGPLDETPAGSLDGEVSDIEQSRFAVDSAPTGLSGGRNIIFYYLEAAPDTNAIEVMANNKAPGTGLALSLATIKGFQGTAKDISCWKTYGKIAPATSNWLAVLENNSDTSWQIALFSQTGTLIERSDPINGKPLWIDCDNYNTRIHVWANDGGTLKYYIFGWS